MPARPLTTPWWANPPIARRKITGSCNSEQKKHETTRCSWFVLFFTSSPLSQMIPFKQLTSRKTAGIFYLSLCAESYVSPPTAETKMVKSSVETNDLWARHAQVGTLYTTDGVNVGGTQDTCTLMPGRKHPTPRMFATHRVPIRKTTFWSTLTDVPRATTSNA